jgi:hypothetical protein
VQREVFEIKLLFWCGIGHGRVPGELGPQLAAVEAAEL